MHILVRAAAGTVSNQYTVILNTIRKLTASSPLARPTPITPPTAAWVVDTGSPIFEAISTVVAAAKSTENPLVLLRVVIRVPRVSMTRYPAMDIPNAMPTPPNKSRKIGTGTVAPTLPVLTRK